MVLILGERLALAGEFCDQLPGGLRAGLRGLASVLEQEPTRLELQTGVVPATQDRLSPGYRAWALQLAKPTTEQAAQLRTLGYTSLSRLNFCLLGFLGISLVAGGLLFGQRKSPAEPKPPQVLSRVLGVFLLWDVLNFFVLPRLSAAVTTTVTSRVLLSLSLGYLALGALLVWANRHQEWKPGSPDWRWAGVGYFAALLTVPVLYGLLQLLTGDSPTINGNLVALFQSSQTGMRVVFIVVLCLVAPLFEELLYRGWLLEHLGQKLGAGWGLLLSALLFSLLHGDPGGTLEFALLGLIFGSVYWKTRSVLASTAVHILWNGINICYLFASLP